MWDPYGNLDKLPVAVVNEDKAVSYNDRELNVGEELTGSAQRKKNRFALILWMQRQQREGSGHGTYYMVITIPGGFFRKCCYGDG